MTCDRHLPRPGQRLRGFTLIEVVVAMTILSLIVLATLTAMRTLGQTQTKLEQRAESTARMRAVSTFLRRNLEQAHPVLLFQFGVPAGRYFYGGDQELIWAGPMPIPGMQGGLASVNLRLNDDNQLILLVRDGVNFMPWEDDTPYLLANDVNSFNVSYRANPWSDWVSEWEMSEEVPTHVRINVQVNERYWPELVVAVPRG